jgi:PD-(D/E)XK endonuclease
MPAKTTAKGELGEAMVIADLIRQGHDVAIPFGHNKPYDLIVIRDEDGRLEKVQVKYTTSDGRTVRVKAESTSSWVRHAYTAQEVDWIAVYDSTTDQCFYVPSSVWDGHSGVTLRLEPAANGQKKLVRRADGFRRLAGTVDGVAPYGPTSAPQLPFQAPPE